MADKSYCRIYLIRHGQTDWNLEKRIQGRNPIPLNKAGNKQAIELASTLRKVDFAAVYTSDIQRAIETAQIIAVERDLAVDLTKSMRERAYGPLVGHSSDEYTDKIKRRLDEYYAISDIDKRWRHRPMRGHESNDDIKQRTLRFLREVAAANLGKNVAVVTHGGVIKIILAALGWVSREEFYKVIVPNAAFAVIESDGSDFRVIDTIGINRNNAK